MRDILESVQVVQGLDGTASEDLDHPKVPFTLLIGSLLMSTTEIKYEACLLSWESIKGINFLSDLATKPDEEHRQTTGRCFYARNSFRRVEKRLW